MKTIELLTIEQAIGYEFNNVGLLEQAFTRKSHSNEHGGEHNDILEFYGDEALDYSVSRILRSLFGKISGNSFVSKLDAGDLTILKSYLVEKEMLANRIEKLGFNAYLLMGNGDIDTGQGNTKSVKEDLFEAIIGAVDIDSDSDLKAIDGVVYNMLNPKQYIKEYASDGIDYIELIRKWNHSNNNEDNLEFFSAENSLNNETILELNINNNLESFSGTGSTSSFARRAACRNAYNYLNQEGLLDCKITLTEGIDETNSAAAINDYKTKGILVNVDFNDKHPSEKNENGDIVWPVSLDVEDINGKRYASIAKCTSKPKSKGKVAFDVLKKIGTISIGVGTPIDLIRLTLGGKRKNNKDDKEDNTSIRRVVTKELYNDLKKYDLVNVIEDLNNYDYTPSIDYNDIKKFNGKRISFVFKGGYKKLNDLAINDSIGNCGIVVVKTPYEDILESQKVLNIISSKFKGELQIASKSDRSISNTVITMIIFK